MRPSTFLLPLLLGAASLAPAAPHAALSLKVDSKFHFVAYGDMRFTAATNPKPSDPRVRKTLIEAVAAEKPAFISIGGDIPYKGTQGDDWLEYEKATSAWKGIPVYPCLGNHELQGKSAPKEDDDKREDDKKKKNPADEKMGLENYFSHFPVIGNSRYYSLRAGRLLMLVLDSNPRGIVETEQGQWLKEQLDRVGRETDFVMVVMHHPPYTSSRAEEGRKVATGTREASYKGHETRPSDRALGLYLEGRQKKLKACILVVASHVHNYERQVHGGITYITTGGGGAEPVLIHRQPVDKFKGEGINFHYLSVDVEPGRMVVTMNRLDPDRLDTWTQADTFTLRPLVGSR